MTKIAYMKTKIRFSLMHGGLFLFALLPLSERFDAIFYLCIFLMCALFLAYIVSTFVEFASKHFLPRLIAASQQGNATETLIALLGICVCLYAKQHGLLYFGIFFACVSLIGIVHARSKR